MLSYADAYKIAAEVHKDQKDKAGGPYIDFLQNVADYLKNKGESEDVQVLAILQDLITGATKKTPEGPANFFVGLVGLFSPAD